MQNAEAKKSARAATRASTLSSVASSAAKNALTHEQVNQVLEVAQRAICAPITQFTSRPCLEKLRWRNMPPVGFAHPPAPGNEATNTSLTIPALSGKIESSHEKTSRVCASLGREADVSPQPLVQRLGEDEKSVMKLVINASVELQNLDWIK